MATMFATMMATMAGSAAAGAAGAAATGAAATGAAAAGATAATAATAATGAAAAGAAGATAVSGFSGLSLLTTVIGGLSSIMAGAAEKRALDQQAIDEETRAVQETITGKQDALDALRQLNRETAKIAVAGYASGIGGEGTVKAAQEEALKIGDQNVNLSRENARFQSAARRSQAKEYRISGKAALTGGIFKGISAGLSLFGRRAVRG